jgi:hypothetical protein
MKKPGAECTFRTAEAQQVNDDMLQELTGLLPQFGPNWHLHSLVTMKVEALARLLHYADLYKKIVNVTGVVCEFGVQWGATMAQLINLRSIHEPFNHGRMIYGFDTFEGFRRPHDNDGGHFAEGDYSVAANHEETLTRILGLHEAAAPLSHIEKFQLIKGNASETVPRWLADNPHTVIAMAIFDMDLYEPTRDVLKLVLPRLTRGSLLIFDELNCRKFPGETIALREVIGTHNIHLQRSPLQPFASWAVWGD